jgi:hypothetical protein
MDRWSGCSTEGRRDAGHDGYVFIVSAASCGYRAKWRRRFCGRRQRSFNGSRTPERAMAHVPLLSPVSVGRRLLALGRDGRKRFCQRRFARSRLHGRLRPTRNCRSLRLLLNNHRSTTGRSRRSRIPCWLWMAAGRVEIGKARIVCLAEAQCPPERLRRKGDGFRPRLWL